MAPIPLKRIPIQFARSLTRRWSNRLRLSDNGWEALTTELNLWPTGQAKFWWRDDDATTSTLQLQRLLSVSETFAVPIALAVIPSLTGRSLSARLRGRPDVVVLAHGWSHRNHAQPGRPPAELAAGRRPQEVFCELAEGRARLEDLFETQFRPVQVPPHNFIAADLVKTVARAGFGYISVDRDFAGLRMASRNIHVDVIDWTHNRAAARESILRQLLAALRLRRYGLVSAARPIGLLTHHLVHDTDIWALTETLFHHLTAHGAVSFPSVDEIFPLVRQSPTLFHPPQPLGEKIPP